MGDKKVTIVIIIACLIAAGGLWWWQMQKNSDMPSGTPPPVRSTDDKGESFTGIVTDALEVRHRYINGTHTYRGTMPTPTPCYQVSADARVLESYPEQIVLSFTMTAPPPDLVCILVLAEQPYSLQVRASERATVRGEINGTPVTLNIIDSDSGIEAPPMGVQLIP